MFLNWIAQTTALMFAHSMHAAYMCGTGRLVRGVHVTEMC